MKINLVKDTIDSEDILYLAEWLKTNPRLTKDIYVDKMEKEWAKWNGSQYSIFVNSGSSANLAALYALKLSGRMKNNKVIAPCVSWVTTVSPIIQFGMKPILCETDKKTLGIDIEHLKYLCKKHNPSTLILVHVLGIPCEMDEILKICKDNKINLIEDSCESIGSSYKGKKTGTMGLMGTYSFYYGHHMSTIEGGMLSTDDKELCNIVKSIRAHGWARDLDTETSFNLRNENNIDSFRDLYTFYYPGFNLRPMEIQAFLGLRQLEKIDFICQRRNENLKLYDKLIVNSYWKLDIKREDIYISNFAYPIITPKLKELVKELKKNEIETRPLICGSIRRQPFWKMVEKKISKKEGLFSDLVHDCGCYLPNNHQLKQEEIEYICEIVNGVIK